jgi:hypothetical protein
MIRRLATTVLLLAIATGMLLAAERANHPQVLGSCAVVKTTSIGQDTQVELMVRLTNPGTQPASVEKLTLLAPGPVAAKPQRAILLSPHGEQEMSQEFKLPTRLYESWQRGVRALLIVEMRRDDGIRFHHIIRLNEKSPLRGE